MYFTVDHNVISTAQLLYSMHFIDISLSLIKSQIRKMMISNLIFWKTVDCNKINFGHGYGLKAGIKLNKVQTVRYTYSKSPTHGVKTEHAHSSRKGVVVDAAVSVSIESTVKLLFIHYI